MADGKPHVEEGEYMDRPVVIVYTGHVWQGKPEQVTMGIRKARAVVDCIDAIAAWVDEQDSGDGKRKGLEKEADRILRNAGENPRSVGSKDGMPF